MKDIGGNFEVEKFEADSLLWGGNDFESGVLSLGDGEKASDGAVLTRGDDGKFRVAKDSKEGALFVLVDRGDFSKAGDYAVRVCISGVLNRSRLSVGGASLSVGDVDALRGWGIIAKK